MYDNLDANVYKPDILDQSQLESLSKVLDHYDYTNTTIIDKHKESVTHDMKHQRKKKILKNLRKFLDSHSHSINIHDKVEKEINIKDNMKDLKIEKDSLLKSVAKNGQTEQLKAEVKLKNNIHIFNCKLETYLWLCIELHKITDIFKLIKFYHYNTHKNFYKINLGCYNIAIYAMALRNDYENIKILLKLMKNDNVKPNSETFFDILLCLSARKTCDNNLENIENTLNLMKNENINIDSLFTFKRDYDCSDKHSIVHETVRRVYPDYKLPQSEEVPEIYTCNLALNLNDKMYNNKLDSQIKTLLNKEDLLYLAFEQFDVEEKGELNIPRIDLDFETRNLEEYSKIVTNLEEGWRKVLHEELSSYLSNSLHRNKMSNSFYLRLLDINEYVEIMIRVVRNLSYLSPHYGSSRNHIVRDIGRQVYKKYSFKYLEQKGYTDMVKMIYSDYCYWFLSRNDPKEIACYRLYFQKLLNDYKKKGCNVNFAKSWSNHVIFDVGLVLYNIMLKSLHITKYSDDDLSPVLYEIFNYQNVEDPLEVKINLTVFDVYKNAKDHSISFSSEELPMFSPPVPWLDINKGGYIFGSSTLVRYSSHPELQMGRLKETGPQNIYTVLDALTSLGSLPWKINEKTLDIITDLFKKGNMPDLDIPLNPAKAVNKKISIEASGGSSIYEKQLAQYNKEKNEMRSLWCDALYKLSLANYFKNKLFWLPYNVDFRGRSYPCPPHLNHFSSDIFRSLFLFGEGKKLGSRGLWWLKLHLVNLTSFKKHDSFETRVAYCEELLPEIFDSADNPMTGNKWWMTSDTPWQTLAACFELTAALRSNNPSEYVSYLPIHQDGSCNGLQHYAAIGRDSRGAKSVNLVPSILKMVGFVFIFSLLDIFKTLLMLNKTEFLALGVNVIVKLLMT